MEQKGRKQKPLKQIALPEEIPALKEAEIGILSEEVPTITGNHSGQATGHGCRPLTEHFPQLCN